MRSGNAIHLASPLILCIHIRKLCRSAENGVIEFAAKANSNVAHYGNLQMLRIRGLATAILIALAKATKGGFCKMTSAEIQKALAEASEQLR